SDDHAAQHGRAERLGDRRWLAPRLDPHRRLEQGEWSRLGDLCKRKRRADNRGFLPGRAVRTTPDREKAAVVCAALAFAKVTEPGPLTLLQATVRIEPG